MSNDTNGITSYFNSTPKQRFLSTLSEGEFNVYQRVLSKASELEEQLGKDLCFFNFEELHNFLRLLQPKKINASRTHITAINKYINWAMTEGLRSRTNPFAEIRTEGILREFVQDDLETIFHYETLKDIMDCCLNAQDAVIVQLCFEGVTGHGLAELLNLQRKDVDFENKKLSLTDDDGSVRILKVSEDCLRLVKIALEQTHYYKRNGEASDNSKSLYVNLVRNDYVLKTGVTRNEGEGKADKFLVYRRLKVIGEIFDKPSLTITNIRDSGMLKMAKDLFKEHDKLEKEEYHLICERFNIGKIKLNGELQYNYFPYKKVFLNVETIRQIYGI